MSHTLAPTWRDAFVGALKAVGLMLAWCVFVMSLGLLARSSVELFRIGWRMFQ